MENTFAGLPVELLEYLLSLFLAQRDFKSLKSLACVNALFCTISQRLLLRKAYLPEHKFFPNIPSPPPSYHFLHDLDRSPHLAEYIRSLTLERSWQDVRARGGSRNDPPMSEVSDDSVAHVLQRFNGLQKFAVFGRKSQISKKPSQPSAWTSFSLLFQKSLIQCISSPNLIELDLTAIGDFPASMLAQCTALTHLSVTSLALNEGSTEEAHTSTRRKLEYLHLEDMGFSKGILSWLGISDVFDITHISDLSLSIDIAKTMYEAGVSAFGWTNLKHLRLVADVKGEFLVPQYLS